MPSSCQSWTPSDKTVWIRASMAPSTLNTLQNTDKHRLTLGSNNTIKVKKHKKYLLKAILVVNTSLL